MKAYLFIAPFLGMAVFAAASGLPTLTAEIGEPVTPESLGGCSMKCTFHWTVTATKKGDSTATRVIVLNDERADTAWTDNTGGIGSKLTFYFPKSIPSEMEGKVPFYGLDVINGNCRSESLWKASARLKKARMYYNNKPLYDINFPDSRKWEHVNFGDIMVRSGDIVTLEVIETYPGQGSAPLAISEITLQGAH